MIHAQPTSVVQNVLAASPSAPKSKNAYCPAICARLAITMTSATTMPQPPIHPVRGPKARDAQAKVVPQSGWTALSSR